MLDRQFFPDSANHRYLRHKIYNRFRIGDHFAFAIHVDRLRYVLPMMTFGQLVYGPLDHLSDKERERRYLWDRPISAARDIFIVSHAAEVDIRGPLYFYTPEDMDRRGFGHLVEQKYRDQWASPAGCSVANSYYMADAKKHHRYEDQETLDAESDLIVEDTFKNGAVTWDLVDVERQDDYTSPGSVSQRHSGGGDQVEPQGADCESDVEQPDRFDLQFTHDFGVTRRTMGDNASTVRGNSFGVVHSKEYHQRAHDLHQIDPQRFPLHADRTAAARMIHLMTFALHRFPFFMWMASGAESVLVHRSQVYGVDTVTANVFHDRFAYPGDLYLVLNIQWCGERPWSVPGQEQGHVPHDGTETRQRRAGGS